MSASSELIIGIDAGTSVIKAIAFDLAGRQVGEASVPNVHVEQPGGGVEQDMQATWARCRQTLQQLVASTPDLARRAVGIGVTGQGDGTWLTDAHGEPAGPALLWMDGRAGDIVAMLRAEASDSVRYTATGTGLAACQQGPQLRWLQANRPEQLSLATHAMHCKDWLYARLTGEFVTDHSEAMFSFGDFRTGAYSDAAIEALGLGVLRPLLPPILDGTREHHPLSDEAASQTGLNAGLPVVLASVDVVCSALAAGLRGGQRSAAAKGAGCTIVGTTGIHLKHAGSAEAVGLNVDRTGYTIPFPVPGEFVQLQSNLSGALNVDWLLDMAAGLVEDVTGQRPSRASLLDRLDDWIASAQPSDLLFQPYVSSAGERGPFIEPAARAGFVGLTRQHGFAELARAVVDGLCLASRDCYEAMGGLPSHVLLTGGAARSAALVQTLATVLEAPVRRSAQPETGAAGAAMTAAVSIGAVADMPGCIDRWVRPLSDQAVLPEQALIEPYRAQFAAHRQIRQVLAPVWRDRTNHSATRSQS